MFKYSIFSDEISPDLSEALTFAVENNLDYIELRSVNKINLIDLDLEEIVYFSKQIRQANLQSYCYPSPLFKWPWNFKENRHLIEKGLSIAQILGCKYIRIFSYLKSKEFSEAQYAEELKNANQLAEEKDLYLVLENEPSCNIQTFRELFSFIVKYPFSRLLALPDLGNQTEAETSFDLAEFEQLIPMSPCIHIKDYSRLKSAYVPVGEGNGRISEWLSILNKNTHKPVLTLETHVPKSPKTASHLSLTYLRTAAGK